MAICPKCGSKHIHAGKRGYSISKGIVGHLLFNGIGLIAGAIGSNKTELTCLDCGHTFNPGDSKNDEIINSIINSYQPSNYSLNEGNQKNTPPQKTTKYQKVRISTLLKYRDAISDSKVSLLEELEKEGALFVEIPNGEIENIIKSKTKGIKRIISFRETESEYQ